MKGGVARSEKGGRSLRGCARRMAFSRLRNAPENRRWHRSLRSQKVSWSHWSHWRRLGLTTPETPFAATGPSASESGYAGQVSLCPCWPSMSTRAFALATTNVCGQEGRTGALARRICTPSVSQHPNWQQTDILVSGRTIPCRLV